MAIEQISTGLSLLRSSAARNGEGTGLSGIDRLPWVEGADNFAPLKSLGWQVHVYGSAPASLREFAAGAHLPLHEWPWTPAAQGAGLERDALYLVRPDGYVGAIVASENLKALERYLHALGLVAETS